MKSNLEHWAKSIQPYQWKTLLAAQLGWMLDAMDIMFYAFALTAIQNEFKLSSAVAGALALTAFFFLLGAVIIFLLPETKGRTLT
jgi:MFS transporter, SHS family, sialic acid transporter